MNEFDLKKAVQDATRAEQLMNDPMIQSSLKKMRENVYLNIRTSHYKDIDDREDLYKMLRVMDEFEEAFKRVMKGGQVAQSKLRQLKSKLKII